MAKQHNRFSIRTGAGTPWVAVARGDAHKLLRLTCTRSAERLPTGARKLALFNGLQMLVESPILWDRWNRSL